MLKLPVNLNTFKKSFLDGDGNLEISSDQDIWKTLYDAGTSFTSDVESLVHVKIGGGASKDLQFGQSGPTGLKVSASASGEAIGDIKLIWPGSSDPLLESYQLQNNLQPGRLYAAISLSGKADASVKGSTALFGGPLKTSFGAGAGARVGYDRLVPFKSTDSARTIVDEIFGGVRLPQVVTGVSEIPLDGEVIAFRYGGYLNLSASLAWGYSLTGTSDLQGLNLELALKYSVRLMASASFAYRLAGEFSIEARRGADPNWARFVVRKSRDSSLQFAADFGFQAESKLSGLPGTPDKLLAALLGTDGKTIANLIAKVEANSSLEGLEKTVGRLARKFIYDSADLWIGKALDNQTVKEFLDVAHQVVERYQTIDQRIIDLYEDFLDDKLPNLDALLNLLTGVGSREDLKNLNDGEAWDLIRRLWNDKLHDLLLEEEEFQKFSAFLKEVQGFKSGGSDKLVRDFIARVKKEFPLDGLLNELSNYDTPAKLKALADEKLQAFVGRLIGRTFSALSTNDDFKQALKQIKTIKDGLANFRRRYSNAVKLAAHQSFAFHLNYLYKRTNKGEALLDLEIDLSNPKGPTCAENALNGDFSDVLREYDPAVVRINKGRLTHDLGRSAQVGISVFNWNYKGIVKLVQHSEHSVEVVNNGLMHVFSIDTSNTQTTEREWKKLKEKVRSNFLLSIVGNTFQPVSQPGVGLSDDDKYLIENLRSITASYELLYEDDRTRPAELTQYLVLAEYLDLVGSASQVVAEYESQFPGGLGKVSVSYVVRYDDSAVRNGLSGSGLDDLRWYARLSARHLITSALLRLKITNPLSWMGFAYQDQNLYAKYRDIGNPDAFSKLHIEVNMPKWFFGGGKRLLHKELLWTLATFYSIEDKFVKRLGRLSQLVKTSPGGKIPEDEVRAATLDFVDMADDLDSLGGRSTFFAVFDRLAQQGIKLGGKRESALILEITPTGGKKITKYLVA